MKHAHDRAFELSFVSPNDRPVSFQIFLGGPLLSVPSVPSVPCAVECSKPSLGQQVVLLQKCCRSVKTWQLTDLRHATCNKATRPCQHCCRNTNSRGPDGKHKRCGSGKLQAKRCLASFGTKGGPPFLALGRLRADPHLAESLCEAGVGGAVRCLRPGLFSVFGF